MIQRLQTLWLLLAAGFAFLSFKLPFYSGQKLVKNVSQQAVVNATSDFSLMFIAGAVILLSIITIFLFKNRKRQLTLTIINIIVSLILLVAYYLQIAKFTQGTVALWCLFPCFIPIFLILAANGIWKDEKLIKSLDRLR
jgi:peptidoglycan/LPS O-acetylase OafA/YrhL